MAWSMQWSDEDDDNNSGRHILYTMREEYIEIVHVHYADKRNHKDGAQVAQLEKTIIA